MKKVYEYQNGTICVMSPESCDHEELKRATEEFLKRVINGGTNNGNSNTSRDFREK